MFQAPASQKPFFLVNPGFLFRRSTARLILVAWFLVFLWLTLGMFRENNPGVNLIPFSSILHDVQEFNHEFFMNFLGNLAAFLPLGFFLPFARAERTSPSFIIGAGIAVSSLIEILQYLSGHRVCDVDDVILNTTSTMIGYQMAIYYILREWRRTTGRSN